MEQANCKYMYFKIKDIVFFFHFGELFFMQLIDLLWKQRVLGIDKAT